MSNPSNLCKLYLVTWKFPPIFSTHRKLSYMCASSDTHHFEP